MPGIEKEQLRLSQQKRHGRLLSKIMSNRFYRHRDLLVLEGTEYKSKQGVDHEMEWLDHVLCHVETLEHFSAAHEVIDLNSYKIYRDTGRVKKAVLRRDFRSFEFICNKN